MESDDCQVGSKPDELGILTDPKLIEEGWVRRHLADPDRAREAIELYRSMGFQVKAKPLSTRDFGARCQLCAETVCGSYVMIYTRK